MGRVTTARSPALRSGRVAKVVAAVAVTLAIVGGLGWLGQTASPGIPAETTVIRVGAGETVWDVARRVAPESDQRAVVERIRHLNGLIGSAIAPGQQLQVPHEQSPTYDDWYGEPSQHDEITALRREAHAMP
jgi:hypothetical protein